ncbi:MAG TPA: hypothetical protein PLZ94_01060 [Armatimonadota bacterium]|nr:hypothetical protein [Armatimonadota bacterium]
MALSHSYLYLIPLLLVIATGAWGAAADLPDPYRRSDQPTIGPAPVPVMEQVFWVEAPFDPGLEVKITLPEGVQLLDRTKPGRGRTRTRFYLRANRGIEKGSITLAPANGPTFSLPLTVRTYRQDIEEQIRVVPGIDPTARKRGRSYYTDRKVALARQNLERYPKLREELVRPSRYDGKSDEEIFASLPSWNVPRECYSNWPCPKCGEAIYRVNAFYPWRNNTATPFKAQCPVCKQLFPTNDYARGDFTSGDYPDDGWGWDPGTGKRDDYAGWVAYYNHHAVWQNFGGEVLRMAQRALLFGDRAAAHKVGVILARVAYVYPGMNMRWQQVDSHYLRPGRLLLDGNWERNEILVPLVRAYDAVFDLLGEDQALADFLHTKDPAIRTPVDVRALIDTYVVQLFGWDWMRRELSGGNMGAREEDMAQFAVCADMGAVSDRWIEELFTHAYNSGTNMGGFDDETLVNTTTREGPVWISALGYAVDYLNSKSDMAEILSEVNSPRWKARCNLYDETLYPKLRAEFDTWLDFVVAGRFGPSYGDSGAGNTAAYPKGIPAAVRTTYERAYRRWPTDRLARALFRLGPRDPGLFEEDIWPQVAAHAKKAGPEPPLESRVLDGVGFVFLESRAHAAQEEERAGIALRYGYGRGHHHQDNLNIEMFAKGLSVAPELGYPCWAHPMGDTAHVAHHNTGMIDRSGQYRSAISRGDLELFAGAPVASFADVSAAPDGFPNRVYRRAVCLADAPGGNVYLLDILRLAGGTTRTYCFHGPGHDDFQSSLTFGEKGTVYKVSGITRGLANNMVEPQAAAFDGDVWADWKCQEKPVRLRITHLGRPGRRYITARCAKPDIPPIRYLFAEEEGADGASEFIALWQPYEGEPFIQKVERLPVEGARPGGEFAPVALRVTLAGGQVDTFFYSWNPDALLRAGGLEFRGSFGYWSEKEGVLRALHLVNGERLRRGNEGVSEIPPAFRSRVIRADLRKSEITLEHPIPRDLVRPGQLIYLRGGNHRSAYHLEEASDDGKQARLDLNSILFRSKLMSVSPDRRCLITETAPPVEAASGFKPGYYNGTVATGEDLKARYRVVSVEKESILLDRPVKDEDFPDVDGDGRRMVSLYEFGEGDEVVVYRSVFIRKGQP